jgi:cytochrome d ubiquinol oxidase subunit I
MSEQEIFSRLQFAFTIGFHILWPAYSIGIASFVALLNGLWVATGRPVYQQLMRFWLRLLALGFAMGVVTGVVLSYEVGTNWAGFARDTGPVIGPLFTYETLTAFFLEAGFLGIALLGEGRVGRGLHLFACIMVAFGTMFSAFWILAANSWMQTPAGVMRDAAGMFHVTSWWDVVFNPSFPFRLAHMVCACFVTGALFVAGVSALQMRHRGTPEHARVALSLALWLLLILAPLQMVLGDMHGLNTRAHQPVKLAAIEGRWETGRAVPLTLFALPDDEAEQNRYTIEVPHLGSLILTHEWNGEVRGLKEVPRSDRPNVPIVFFAFRIMVGAGVAILAIALWGAWLRWRGRLFYAPRFHKLLVVAMPLGWVAILAGWTVTEAGRQPFVVYGLLRTADAVSPVTAGATMSSLLLFAAVYGSLFLAFLWYWLATVLRGPADVPQVVAMQKSRLVTLPHIIDPAITAAPSKEHAS